MDDCYTFREQLTIKYPTRGHALWEPDPGGLYSAVDVGDVGFIREGIFCRLFNALLPIGHPSNPPSRNYPPQLQPKLSSHIRKSRDDHKYFHSSNVTISCKPEIHAIRNFSLMSPQILVAYTYVDPMTYGSHFHAPGGEVLCHIFLCRQNTRTLLPVTILVDGWSAISTAV